MSKRCNFLVSIFFIILRKSPALNLNLSKGFTMFFGSKIIDREHKWSFPSILHTFRSTPPKLHLQENPRWSSSRSTHCFRDKVDWIFWEDDGFLSHQTFLKIYNKRYSHHIVLSFRANKLIIVHLKALFTTSFLTF